MSILVYPRGFYEHQLSEGRPTGAVLALSTLQVQVSISPEELDQLEVDATVACHIGDDVDDGLRLVARGTVSRIRMHRNLPVLRKGRYSEED